MKLLFLIFCIFTISCSNEDKLNCESIELSSNSIHILAGEKRTVYILSDLEKFQMGLGLQSENPQIATVEPQNDSKASCHFAVQLLLFGDSLTVIQTPLGILYSFDKDTKAVEIDYSSSDYDNNKRIGTYEWDKDSLTLNFNNSISKHGFAVVNDHTIIIVLDFTEKYKSKYPNASVKGAKIQCFLSAIE